MAEAFKNSDIEILVATMHRHSLDFLVPMFPMCHFSELNIVVINQTSPDYIITSDYPTVKVINVFEKGLSKSRNLALKNATGALCIITDDDVVFTTDFRENICTAFNENNTATLITFRAEKQAGKLYREYPLQRITKLGLFNRLTIISIEMVVNRRLIQESGITFNEYFGLGSQFKMGEEAIFVNDIYKKGLKIIMEPIVIARHENHDTHVKVSLWDKYYIQGALFTKIFGNNYFLLVFMKLGHEIKHNQIKVKQVPTAIKAAIRGRIAFNKTL